MGASTHQSPRQRRSDELAYVVRCLTDRDRQIVEAVARFGVFTAEHIAEMFFDSLKRAQVRLQRLHALRVLDRFQPYRAGWGSSPYHYILGANGAEFVEAAGGGFRPRVRRPGHRLALGRRRDLDHVVLVNGLYEGLLGDARRGAGELKDWLTADEVAVWSDGTSTPMPSRHGERTVLRLSSSLRSIVEGAGQAAFRERLHATGGWRQSGVPGRGSSSSPRRTVARRRSEKRSIAGRLRLQPPISPSA